MSTKIFPQAQGSYLDENNDFCNDQAADSPNQGNSQKRGGSYVSSSGSPERFSLAEITTTTFRAVDQLLLRLFQTRENFQKRIEKEFNELTLEEQTESHKRDDNLFYWVRYGDLNTLKEKIIKVLAEGNIKL